MNGIVPVSYTHLDVYKRQPEDRRRLFLISTIRGKQVEQHIGSLVLKRFSNWLDVYGKDRGTELLDLLEDFNKQIVQANYSEEKK